LFEAAFQFYYSSLFGTILSPEQNFSPVNHALDIQSSEPFFLFLGVIYNNQITQLRKFLYFNFSGILGTDLRE